MEKAGKEREQKLSFRFVLTRLVIENSKTTATKLKKIKKYDYGFISIQKNSKKIQKINKHHYGLISSQYRLEKTEKERKEKKSFRFVLTRRVIENSKKIAIELKKIKKYHYGFISVQNWLENHEKERK